MDTADYCREVEAYLCRKNDGHLIRIVGPSFDRVSAWATRGVPMKVAFLGIDRYFERYYAKGPRRRPVRIDFCEADVLDAFDEWRRATGIISADAGAEDVLETAAHKGPSLPAHLERVLRRLTTARVAGTLDPGFDSLLDRVAQELDAARSKAKGLRGRAREALLERLAELDRELLNAARARLDEATEVRLTREADEDLASFRSRMEADAFARARDATIDRLVRDHAGLPTITFS